MPVSPSARSHRTLFHDAHMVQPLEDDASVSHEAERICGAEGLPPVRFELSRRAP
jgi:hypothetical protein